MKFFIICLFLTNIVYADWKLEEKKIQFLIKQVSLVKGSFIRNGDVHSPKEAASHMSMKFNNAKSSWFAPDKEEWTANMFIEKLASKSSLSGKPYFIQLSDGKRIKSEVWLKKRLKDFKP